MTDFDTSQKIVSRGAAARWVKKLQAQGRKVVFTNGCFNLLHPGHVAYLEQARSLGDALVVGVNTDDSVRRLGKGQIRPVTGEADRARVLAALACVDRVVLFDEDTPLELITLLKPDILVKGGDYQLSEIVGRVEVLARVARSEPCPSSRGIPPRHCCNASAGGNNSESRGVFPY